MFARMVLGLAALLTAALLTLAPTPVEAKRCVADSECRNALSRNAGTRCVGDTLVRSTTRCIGGRCVTRETRRQRCATGKRGRCSGGSHFQTIGRCDPLNGSCSTRTVSRRCLKTCVCNKNILTVSTGECSPNIGCHRAVKKCPGGCSCDPEPACKP